MKLCALSLRNWRNIAELDLPHLDVPFVVLSGPNRIGKSSLFAAIRCGLIDFDHDSRDALIREAVPWQSQLIPEVAVEFETAGARYPLAFAATEGARAALSSIRAHGLLQPLVVAPLGGEQAVGKARFQLIAGERRWRASKKLGLETVPVIEREASDREVLEMALIENLQREDLNPMEEAAGYVRLAKEFSMKQDEIAASVGKSRASVANAMRLLDLHQDVQLMVAQGHLTVGHAKAVLSIKDTATQLLAADQILKRKLTVRATEKLAQSFLTGGGSSGKTGKPELFPEVDVQINAITNRLRDRLATHVSIHHAPKKGRIEIEYYGDDDLQRVLELLGVESVD